MLPPASYPTEGPLDQTEIGVLLLKDGTCYQGVSFGARRPISGECVFQTGMVGYSESLTDPSYRGQILVMTFPLIGNYGVPSRQAVENGIMKHFESSQIHVAGLIVAGYTEKFSHYLAESSLSDWLKEQNIPALYGIDTRVLTKKIRENGSTLSKLLFCDGTSLGTDNIELATFKPESISWTDPNATNLVAEVSTKVVREFKAVGTPLNLRIMAVDVGMKFNQIRCFINRGVDLTVVPWDFDFVKAQASFDGLFISNGPGDPTMCGIVIERLKAVMADKKKPIFGICLGHQLLALSAGAKSKKMLFGNRGHNIPCTDLQTGRCYITSQNHGFAVDTESLIQGWKEWFVNANDASNEGIMHETLPYFSVQFHPESTPGPRDTEFLFDMFIKVVKDCVDSKKLVSVVKPPVDAICKPVRVQVNKVLILGSGGLSIGQAGEFDYSGSQAIKAMKEEGIYTVLINPNIATIQTSKGLADKVYFLPVTPEFVRKVINFEKPDGIYVSFGGQTALNCGIAMKDEFEGLGVKVLGTTIDTVIVTEDRELFAAKMAEINEKCAESASAVNVKEALAAAKKIGFPLIVRAAYALGGLGSGFAQNEKELTELCSKAFAFSPQVLIERSMKGWKEIEYEVVRDINDNCITVCNMENFDPLGIHTGDSIVVAPSQTLSDADYNMLRTTAVNVIRHLGVVGECNIQYALNPDSQEYCIIEVNARLSRSSALASKATGYPLAFVAAKLGLNIPLSELKNNVTKVTCACFEPSLDYVVVKIPRWDLRKFSRVSTKVGSAMKSVGEVMSIGRNFEETMQKALRSIDNQFLGFVNNGIVKDEDVEEELRNPSDKRVFAIAQALHSGKYTIKQIFDMTKIDKWFLNKLKNIVDLDQILARQKAAELPIPLLRQSKQLGFSDRQIAKLIGTSEMAVRKTRLDAGIVPFVKQIDTVAAEFPAYTNYLFTTYNALENDVVFNEMGVMVIGSGVYRIGSSVEFDWCAVRTIRTLREQGYKTIMVNYNPETVSTDYDEADRLYFENISLETVLDIYQLERSTGVIVSMGGQTPNNIALQLYREGVKIYGTSPEQIDGAENRYKFSRMCDTIGVDQPRWKELTSMTEASSFCDKVGFPVLVRPSYVLSGAAMNVVYSAEDLQSYLLQAVAVSSEYPVVISKFIEEAKEIEMDAIAQDGELVYHVISEHVENAGVHSGDATLVLPPQDLEAVTVKKIEDATRKIAYALNVTGPFNIQYIAKNNEIKIIECNVRASRSFPFVSKVLGIDMIELATKAMMGIPFEAYPQSPVPQSDYVCIKVPQFSFGRLGGADPVLGVEMASTGEVACFGKNKYEAYMKALISTGFVLPKKNILLSIGSFKEKQEFLPSVWKLHRLGYNIFATSGTADFISEHGVPVKVLESFDGDAANDQQKAEFSLHQHLASNLIDLYINLPSRNKFRRPANYVSKGYRTRRMAVDLSIPLITNVKCAKLFVEALSRPHDFPISSVDSQTSHHVISLPGLVDIGCFAGPKDVDLISLSKNCVAGGFSFLLVVNGDQLANTVPSFIDFSVGCAKRGNKSMEVVFIDLQKSDLSLKELGHKISATSISTRLIACASGANLAALLYLSQLHKRSLHITGVFLESDVEILALAKESGQAVTFDVAVWNLFLNRDSIEGSQQFLGSKSDVDALWSHIDVIDCFSTGRIGQELSRTQGAVDADHSEKRLCLPLLLTAVKDGLLTLQDVTDRFYTNPFKILQLPTDKGTFLELEIDRQISTLQEKSNIKSLALFMEKKLFGKICRVSIRDQVVFVDGSYPDQEPVGREVLLSLAQVQQDRKTPSPQKSRQLTKSQTLAFEQPREGLGDNLGLILDGQTSSDRIGHDQLQDSNSSAIKLRPKSPSILGKPREVSLVPAEMSIGQFNRQHILSVRQFTRAELHILFTAAHEMSTIVERHGTVNVLSGKVLCNLFYEPSTRTSCSFESAMIRLGGQVINVNQVTSSVQKGESLSDTIRTVGCYADAVVIRHPDVGSAQTAAKFSKVPVLNAGDGSGEHPTQAFLDVYTIREELGTVNGLNITIIGDLKHGRTVHSLVKILALYDVKISYVSPESLRMPEQLVSELRQRGLQQQFFTELNDELICHTDVLYVTRIQKERFDNPNAYEAVKDSFRITNNVLLKAKPNMIVMHPLPRVNEIDPEVDFDARAAYFRQMKYGLYVRMALLALVLGKQ